jgi:hypothetical protein
MTGLVIVSHCTRPQLFPLKSTRSFAGSSVQGGAFPQEVPARQDAATGALNETLKMARFLTGFQLLMRNAR